MASACYSEDLTCSICLTIFTEPVTLPCGHSFCRRCITDILSSQHQCPYCRTAVPTEAKCLPVSYILKSLVEKAKEQEKMKTEPGHEKAEVVELCPEHEEKLKLFCVTDQQLACIICRDGEKHEGHKFKPIKEAAGSLRKELETFMLHVSDDTHSIEILTNKQSEEIAKTKKKSQQLETQIHRQFEEMHQFLRKREDEIKNELKHKEEDAVEKMSESLNVIQTVLSESIMLQRKVTSVLKTEESEKFLKSWTDGNMVTAKRPSRPKGKALRVLNTSLSLGPYESHLQFFMWKEMLQVIQPRAELLTLKTQNTNLNVSEDKRSVFGFQRPPGYPNETVKRYSHFLLSNCTPNSTESTNQFTSGQHYWEIDVGKRNYWKLGIKKYFLKYNGQTFAACHQGCSTALTFAGRPRKIGIYLNCSSTELSFYDADNMSHMHTMSYRMSLPLSAYFNVGINNPDPSPLTVCWY